MISMSRIPYEIGSKSRHAIRAYRVRFGVHFVGRSARDYDI